MSMARVICVALWALVALLVVTVWVVAFTHGAQGALLVGVTMLPAVAAAALWNVRCQLQCACRVVIAAMSERSEGSRSVSRLR